MKCLLVTIVIFGLGVATPVPSGTSTTTTTRSPAQIGDTIKQLTNQLMEVNATDAVTLDIRTPPKIKQHTKKKTKLPEVFENSHAGVAIPVDEDEVVLEETTKKLNFYKIEKPTTNGGLSTWILLSGQTTPKPTRKSNIKPTEKQNITTVVDNKIVKPIFKKRTTTTTTTAPTTTKLTKIKASILHGAKKAVNTTTTTTTTTTPKTSATTVSITTTTTNSSDLPLEAKETETELVTSSDAKKTRRPTTKRKKNKNRRRKPADKNDTASTKIDKPLKNKEKPIGTQLYNYLSREVMPTVGVGLVGLMVTAGLAGYFLYPFGIARRSYEINRRGDKDNQYFYSDQYGGGIAEEEAIGKVIAGMSSNSLYGNNFKTPTSRHSFNNNKHRRVIEQSTGYTISEEVTPAAVPEHGPRSLRVRRQIPEIINNEENEIDATTKIVTTVRPTSTSESTSLKPDRVKTFVDTLRELFHLKMYLGLQLLQNATQAVSKYFSHVQRRLDHHYHNYTLY